ncbi:Sugar kinase of the NBD/HSP70 family, may contain an N-terminal HTH domain [Klenkia marina]|uniref:Sugar kinase of the NBD/HSP70 family, may contain an N-terminal HTH domain n=1 Tax=Klenkia marina TaxID=1960309 RepID=A0A1G4XFP0_9ACTN|nr:ROK family protein [Klenkia marina]SCX39967.1 Sugar kinase of the NBD/HSP70 family, may contain an N-terminal HTH domain [Klenkia marina]
MPDLDDSVRQVAVHVLRHGPAPRGAVARALGLSAGSLTRLGKPLLDAGVLVETTPVTDPATRRPTRPLDVVLDPHRFVGVSVTGTGAWAVATDLRAQVRRRAHRPLTGTAPAQVAAAVAGLVEELGGPPTGVGVALAGVADGAGRVLQADALDWRPGVDLAALVAAHTGGPVVVDDDVACLAATEHWFGLGREQPAFALLTLDTRVGYGLVVGDAVVRTAGPQLVGHLPIEPGGPRCPQGHRGCAGALVTVPALLAAAHVAYGRPVTWRDLLVDAVDRVDRARRVVDDAAAHLGRLVALVSGTTGVVQVVVDGEGADLAVVGYESLQAAVDEHRDPRSPAVEFTVRDPDPYAWARGAAGAAVVEFASGPRWLAGPEAAH